MSKEIEVKVLDVNLDILENKLKAIGAELISIEDQKNIIIDTDNKFKEDNLDGYLRIRETHNKLLNIVEKEITLKENLSREQARENLEIESKISDTDSILYILSKLGYEVSSIGYKARKSYRYDDTRFDLDVWDKKTYPYPYMEVEVELEEDLEKAIRLLDLDRSKITTKSIAELKDERENQRD